MKRRAWLAGSLLLVASCIPGPVAPAAPSDSPSAASPLPSLPQPATTTLDMSATLLAKPLPYANGFVLTRTVRGRDGVPARPFEPVRTTPPDEGVGTARDFWTYDFAAKKNVKTTATLRLVTDHAKWWVGNDATLDLGALRSTASEFETKIYPTDRRLYGEEWSPGIDGDPRINLIFARLPGAAAGYFSGADEEPAWVNEFSAEREIIYVNSLAARPGTSYLSSVIAHEFCHMIQFNTRRRSAVWFNEGHAQLCEQANGFPIQHAQIFLRVPDTQLNDWSDLEASQAHYGLSYLFLEFLRQQAGGDDLIRALMAKGIDTPADIDAVLSQRGQPPLEELFGDFVAANAFIGQSAERRYSYPLGIAARQPAGPAEQDRVAVGGTARTSVRQYAAHYLELPRAAMRIRFDGATSVRIIATDPHSGKAFWWSDKGDGMDSTMTRAVDLRGVGGAVLSFWTWFEIEADYDYAYVEVSTDGGAHWKPLATEASTNMDPNGQNLGNGMTGVSGRGTAPQWTRLTADLSPYAGKELQLRFQYVTDGNLNLGGFAVDDIEISGGILKDDAEADGEWKTEGFVRSTNIVGQRYLVQVLRFGDRTTVERHVVPNGTLSLDLDTSGDRRPPLVAVAAFAVRTTQPASFSLAVEARP
jgi:hypothetical protein